MNKSFKPAGYNSVSPYFIVNDAQKFIDLVKTTCDSIELRAYNRPNGSIMHKEIKIDDTIIMAGDSSDQFPSITLDMYVYVADVDEIFNNAIKAGCEIIELPIAREGDPDRRTTFKVLAGNLWSEGTQV